MQAAAKNVKFHVQPVCRFMQLKRLQVGGALIETRALTTITLPVTSDYSNLCPRHARHAHRKASSLKPSPAPLFGRVFLCVCGCDRLGGLAILVQAGTATAMLWGNLYELGSNSVLLLLPRPCYYSCYVVVLFVLLSVFSVSIKCPGRLGCRLQG